MSQVSAIVSAALALRSSHPAAPALDVLDLVMRGRRAVPADFGVDGLPPAPFALLVADALDSTMTPGEWRVWTAPDAAPRHRGPAGDLARQGLAQNRLTVRLGALGAAQLAMPNVWSVGMPT